MLIAFHGKKEIKKEYLARVTAHQKADDIVKGQYWVNGKGCAVGCTIHSSEHNRYETELGIPEWLARVEDTLFEGMSNKNAKLWPKKFLSAIRPGADLEKAKAPFLILVLKSTLKSVDKKRFPDVVKSIKAVEKLWKDGGTEEEFRQAAYAADAAAHAAADAAHAAAYTASYAADAAAYAADAAAHAAAHAAAYAAADAAHAAADAAAYAARAAGATTYNKFGEGLLKILRSL